MKTRLAPNPEYHQARFEFRLFDAEGNLIPVDHPLRGNKLSPDKTTVLDPIPPFVIVVDPEADP